MNAVTLVSGENVYLFINAVTLAVGEDLCPFVNVITLVAEELLKICLPDLSFLLFEANF